MARFLFVVPPMTGHTNPTVAVAAELERRGHETAWVGHGVVVEKLLRPSARLFSIDGELPAEVLADFAEKARGLRGLAGLKFLWEEVFLPLARAMLPGVERVVLEWQPDVLVVDQQALAGALVARRRGVAWATFATTSADRRESLGDMPRVLAWSEERLAELQREAGLEPVVEPESSPHLVVVFSTEALVGDTRRFPATYRFVGPALPQARNAVEFPWDALKHGIPRVLVSLGTLNMERGERFFRAVAEGLADEPLQVVAVAPEAFGPFPASFVVRPFVPQLELLARVDAVVCHGGHNTVCEALSRGLPLVVAPIKDDQPVVAQQVADAGAGIRVSFTRPRPAVLRDAVRAVLDEPSYRAAARRIQASFADAGGAPRAAELLEALL